MDTKKIVVILIALSISVLPGCATLKKAGEADSLRMENKDLRAMLEKLRKEKDAQVERLRSQKDEEVSKTVEVKDRELQDLQNAMKVLEEQLKKEIGEYKARLQMTERGLVITFLAEVFFDSGKAVPYHRNDARVLAAMV